MMRWGSRSVVGFSFLFSSLILFSGCKKYPQYNATYALSEVRTSGDHALGLMRLPQRISIVDQMESSGRIFGHLLQIRAVPSSVREGDTEDGRPQAVGGFITSLTALTFIQNRLWPEQGTNGLAYRQDSQGPSFGEDCFVVYTYEVIGDFSPTPRLLEDVYPNYKVVYGQELSLGPIDEIPIDEAKQTEFNSIVESQHGIKLILNIQRTAHLVRNGDRCRAVPVSVLNGDFIRVTYLSEDHEFTLANDVRAMIGHPEMNPFSYAPQDNNFENFINQVVGW